MLGPNDTFKLAHSTTLGLAIYAYKEPSQRDTSMGSYCVIDGCGRLILKSSWLGEAIHCQD